MALGLIILMTIAAYTASGVAFWFGASWLTVLAIPFAVGALAGLAMALVGLVIAMTTSTDDWSPAGTIAD